MEDLTPESWRRLAVKMATGDALFGRFRSYYFHGGPALKRPCDRACRRTSLCRLLTSSSGNRRHCGQLDRAVAKERRRSARKAGERRTGRRKEKTSFWDSLFG